MASTVQVEILAYAPTEFYHCQHCEVVWDHLGLGRRIHEEQRTSGLLPADLQAEYAAISDWVREAVEQHGEHLKIKLIDAASVEGVWKAVRHRVRRFPVFIVDGHEKIVGFDRERLNGAVAQRLGPGMEAPWAWERRPHVV